MRLSVLIFFAFLIIPQFDAASQIVNENGTSIEVPQGFRGIELGMELERVKELLREDPCFDYRGDPDVSFLPQTFQTLIECTGNSYIERAFFQFHEKRLAIMILVLDRKGDLGRSLLGAQDHGPGPTVVPS